MSRIKIDAGEELAALFHQSNWSVENAAREMIVLELYRRGTSRRGRAQSCLACHDCGSFTTRADSLLRLLASSGNLMHPEFVQITVDLPDDIAGRADPGREALEALAIEGYRSGKLTHYQASQLLGMTRFEFDGFLKSRDIYDHAYDVEDFEHDLDALRRLEARGILRRG